MLIFRWILLLLAFAAVICVALFVATGDLRWRRLAVRIFKWLVVAGLGFFGLLILERLVLRVL